jgi:hypothetical protein
MKAIVIVCVVALVWGAIALAKAIERMREES